MPVYSVIKDSMVRKEDDGSQTLQSAALSMYAR